MTNKNMGIGRCAMGVCVPFLCFLLVSVLPAHGQEEDAIAPPAPREGEVAADYESAPDPVIENLQSLYDAPETTRPPEEQIKPTSFTAQLMWTFTVLLFLLGAIILLGQLAKRFGARTPALAGLRLGNVLGRIYLTPKASLHYVKTGDRVLVVGVTPAGIHLITEFAADAFEAQLAEPAQAPGANSDDSRLNFLEYINAAQKPDRASADDDLANLRGEIQRLSEFLRESSREPQG